MGSQGAWNVGTWYGGDLYHYDYELVKKIEWVEIFVGVNLLIEEYNFRDFWIRNVFYGHVLTLIIIMVQHFVPTWSRNSVDTV